MTMPALTYPDAEPVTVVFSFARLAGQLTIFSLNVVLAASEPLTISARLVLPPVPMGMVLLFPSPVPPSIFMSPVAVNVTSRLAAIACELSASTSRVLSGVSNIIFFIQINSLLKNHCI